MIRCNKPRCKLVSALEALALPSRRFGSWGLEYMDKPVETAMRDLWKMRILKMTPWVMLVLCGLAWSQQDKPAQEEADPDKARSVWEYLTKRYDGNANGKITREEYTRSDEHFGRLDRDGNGVLEKADTKVRSQRKRRPGGRKRTEAPREGELAPGFALEELGKAQEKAEPKDDDHKRSKAPVLVKLGDLKGKRPVALIFGSYT